MRMEFWSSFHLRDFLHLNSLLFLDFGSVRTPLRVFLHQSSLWRSHVLRRFSLLPRERSASIFFSKSSSAFWSSAEGEGFAVESELDVPEAPAGNIRFPREGAVSPSIKYQIRVKKRPPAHPILWNKKESAFPRIMDSTFRKRTFTFNPIKRQKENPQTIRVDKNKKEINSLWEIGNVEVSCGLEIGTSFCKVRFLIIFFRMPIGGVSWPARSLSGRPRNDVGGGDLFSKNSSGLVSYLYFAHYLRCWLVFLSYLTYLTSFFRRWPMINGWTMLLPLGPPTTNLLM